MLWHDQELHDGEVKSGGDYVSEACNRAVTRSDVLPINAPDKMTVSRWRGRLTEPEAYEAELSKAEERADLICGATGCSGSC